MRIRIVHIIVGLNSGGAEKMLLKLLSYTDKSKYDLKVISMTDEGIYGEHIKKMGIPIYTLNMKRGVPSIKALIKARKIIADVDIIQTWMYHADLLGIILKFTNKNMKLILGIRHSNLSLDGDKLKTLIIAKIISKLSYKAELAISCSKKAKESHLNFGYHKNIYVIPNGFEIDRFYKNPNMIEIKKKLLCIPSDHNVILNIARYHPLKDHKNLFNAVRSILDKRLDITLILCGEGINIENEELIKELKNSGIYEFVKLLDIRSDIPELMAISDVFVSSSKSEGFSNVIGEAMACELPCVVTDVGDSAFIVDSYGKVVPPSNSIELAKGIEEILNSEKLERDILGVNARQRVIENFEINSVVRKYQSIYDSLNIGGK